jgi:aminoglycoside phosphotransferase (APT) family kinase protein
MTDHELLSQVLSCVDPSAEGLRLVRRKGRVLLGLPPAREAAARALGLYQPQRALARLMVTGLRGMAHVGLHGGILSKIHITGGSTSMSPALTGIEPGTCGVLLGSPEHRVRRAIASYRKDGEWEVAKISFGEAGARVLEDEARALEQLQRVAAGVPRMLGLHRGHNVTVMRMPYLSGEAVKPGESTDALELLNQWITGQAPKPITEFAEWTAIASALSGLESGRRALERLMRECLAPVICHGDFARWNLLRKNDGGLVVLDWEWGHSGGLPGIDLVHYFLQDARLVERLGHKQAITAALEAMQRPECRNYLEKTGSSGDQLLAVIACLAYKQGARHQDNAEVLAAALEMLGQR